MLAKNLSLIINSTIFLENIPEKKYIKNIKLWFNKILDRSLEYWSRLINKLM